jgi:hypothetical protein
MATLNTWPVIGAYGADFLRGIFGTRPVAILETGLYSSEDSLKQWANAMGLYARNLSVKLPRSNGADSNLFPTSHNDADQWIPEALIPIRGVKGEGAWQPYLTDSDGRTVACITAFQPDPIRPYAIVNVVAFDLNQTRLHFVLGTEEPISTADIQRPGSIPETDRKAGILVAMFNGGFKAYHGHYGAMADDAIAILAREGLATLAIDKEGGVQIGVWGEDIDPAGDWAAWRQNGLLLIRDGKITEKVYNSSMADWGNTIGGTTPIWRSGIGISADGSTLYYVAGPSLTIKTLTDSLLAAGAANAMQLDINDYWVHFVGVHTSGQNLVLTPLFPEKMDEDVGRYLTNYERDYFYITAIP